MQLSTTVRASDNEMVANVGFKALHSNVELQCKYDT